MAADADGGDVARSSSDNDFQDVVLTVEATAMAHPTATMHVPEVANVPVLHG